MKKKLLLIIVMFLFITNVNALTFNVNLTNIEDKGNNGTIGSITNIDIPNKTIDAYFQDIGDEVNFELTVTNTGDRAGTLRSITITPSNDKIEYTTNLPEGGLAINGNDFNTVTIKAKVLEGAQNGTSSSEIKIRYTYDEGSCPEGEILSDDESMCLCPEGTERNENGICVKPEKETIECKDDEIYNETKKMCEKKVVPTPDGKVTPSNPKTMDNIILITLLFVVSGLGIYAVMFRRLKTKKSKITAGVITGVTTLTLSFTVLAGVFGLDNLLGAIINPITKSKEITITVNEEIDLIETWDGNCDLDVAELTPSNIFDGGSGTESDPYQVKTAEQLSCFAKSVNNGTTYEGQYIKQTKNIKLNDHLIDQVIAGDLSNAHVWISAGDYRLDPAPYFAGTYDGDNKIISGLYITDNSIYSEPNSSGNYKGMFGYAINATFKNMELSDVYMINTTGNYGNTGALLGYGFKSLNLDNIKTYGAGRLKNNSAGIVAYFNGNNEGGVSINRVENNIDLYFEEQGSGIIHYVERIPSSSTPNLVIKNTKNNGNLNYASNVSSMNGGILGRLYAPANVLVANSANTGDFIFDDRTGSMFGGIGGSWDVEKVTMENSYNTGDFYNTGSTFNSGGLMGGLLGIVYGQELTGNNLYNSGNIDFKDERVNFNGMDHYSNNGINAHDSLGGIFGYVSSNRLTLTNSYNTGHFSLYGIYVGGLIGKAARSADNLIENCYNVGDITSTSFTGGLVGYYKGTLTKSYNTGDLTIFAGFDSGGLIAQGERSTSTFVNNSYNAGDIVVTTFGKQNQIGGICGFSCSIENSYNRGNMDFKHQPWSVGGIIGANAGDIKNVYNSGDILVENIVQEARSYPSTMYVSGINGSSSYGTGSGDQNAYNLGNITASYNGVNNIPFGISGVTYANATNSVNAGNITVTINQPYTESRSFYIAGISLWSKVTNSFNAGTITLDDSPLGHSMYDEEFTNAYGDTYKHSIYLGEINSMRTSGSSNNKFNTDPAKLPYYCPNNSWTTCTQEDYDTAGVYTNEDTPDILSIINGDNAFNTELDEEGLPTLRVFNE